MGIVCSTRVQKKSGNSSAALSDRECEKSGPGPRSIENILLTWCMDSNKNQPRYSQAMTVKISVLKNLEKDKLRAETKLDLVFRREVRLKPLSTLFN